MKQIEQIDSIINTHLRLAMIESPRTDTIIDLFAQYGDLRGKAVYVWNIRSGLHRIGFEEMPIQDTKSLAGVLKFIRTSLHYGIYLLEKFPSKRSHKANAELKRIVTANDAFHCFVALLGEKISVEEDLLPHTLKIVCDIGHQDATATIAANPIQQQNSF